MSESKWPRIKWNQACSELANRPFIDLFKESDSMKNDPTSSAVMDYELMRKRAEAAEARAAQAEQDAMQANNAVMQATQYAHGLEAERDEAQRVIAMLQGELNKIKTTLAVGRNVGEDKEQAYQDAEEIADAAISKTEATP